MTEKNKRKAKLKEMRLRAGTFIGFRPKKERPKKGTYNRLEEKRKEKEEWGL